MKTYVTTTMVVFALLFVAHIWRAVVEPTLWKEPWFLLLTLFCAAFSLWGWRVLRHMRRA